MLSTEAKIVHVAVGVIKNANGHILIAKRPDHAHMGGRWEFPGGKVERGESLREALARELKEELGISFTPATQVSPLITIRHRYPEKTVLLDVHMVECFSGEPRGEEGQPVRWVPVAQLNSYTFPDANYPILNALNLPRCLPISKGFDHACQVMQACEFYASKGYKIWHMRSPELNLDRYAACLSVEGLSQYLPNLTLNTSFDIYQQLPFLHLHLSSRRLHELRGTPKLKNGGLLSASCHNLADLDMAHSVGADYVFYSPIKATVSHDDAEPVGWKALETFCEAARVPVYALGGVGELDSDRARACGAQGVAGISGFLR